MDIPSKKFQPLIGARWRRKTMPKVIGHYQAVCPYCGGKTLIQERDNGKLQVRDCCKHFERIYKEGGKIIVRFSVIRDVEAERETQNV